MAKKDLSENKANQLAEEDVDEVRKSIEEGEIDEWPIDPDGVDSLDSEDW